MPRFPAFNPLIYADAVCYQCGKVMHKSMELGPLKRVEKIVYRCQNPESGCDYQVESDQRLTGMMTAVAEHAATR